MWCVPLEAATGENTVGKKAARLAQIFHDYPVPDGFVLVANAYKKHVEGMAFGKILKDLDVTDLDVLLKISGDIKALICDKPIAPEVLEALQPFAKALKNKIAVRSSSLQEDTSTLSFAGQYDSFLDVEPTLLEKYIKLCWASLYTPRVLSYRHHNKLQQENLSMAVLVQDMVYGVSGVAFSANPNTGADEVLLEFDEKGVVHGKTNPTSVTLRQGEMAQTFRSLPASDQNRLVKYTKLLQTRFGCPVDIEWLRNPGGTLHIVQVRPLRVASGTQETRKYISDIPILIGSSVGSGLISGVVQKVTDPRQPFKEGGVLVVRDTSPDWEPLMRRARALITDHGSRTSHASLVAREMGLPAVVGTTDATFSLADGQIVTLDLDKDLGLVYGGAKV